MLTEEERAAVAEAVAEAPPATYDDWFWLLEKANELTVPRCILELSRRVEALEVGGGVAGNPGHASEAPAGVTIHELTRALDHVGCDSAGTAHVLWDHPRIGPLLRGAGASTPAPAEPAPAVLTVEELADCLPANAWAGPEGYSRQAFARHLLEHPRIGALLRGEGAGAPKRVVLPKHLPYPSFYGGGEWYEAGWDSAWFAARAEVERQQQGGQADG